jgi:hypothetical protein
MGIGTVKLFVLFVGGGFLLGFGLPALVFNLLLRKYNTRFKQLAAQIAESADANDR